MWQMRRAVPAVLIVTLGGLTSCGAEDQSPNPGEEGAQAQGSGDEAAHSGAACAADSTEVSDATVAPGESIVVSAQGMWDGCRDGESVDIDEQFPSELPELPPMTDLPVVWRQDSAEAVLATGDANSGGVFELSVTIPDDAQPGTAEITIGIAQSATVTIEPQN